MLILKSKLIVTVISILVITVFVGCEKDLLNSNNPNTLQEVQDLTNRYFENNNTKAKPKGKIWAAVCRIAGKDISGLKEYFSVIYIMDDYSVFYDYSIEFEDIIINASDINDIDKIIILLTASTCRYDIDFWIDNINNI